MELSLNKSGNKSSSNLDDSSKERYEDLKKQYDSMLKAHENIQQELYDLKRSHATTVELKDHLYSEIEALQKNEKIIKAEYIQKCKLVQEELDQAREEKRKEAENFESTIEVLEKQVASLKKEHLSNKPAEKLSVTLDNTKLLEDMRNYEEEIDSLREQNNMLKARLETQVATCELQKSELDIVKEKMNCLESNLSNKKEELESLSEMLHAAQDDLCAANMQLQQYKNSSSTMAPKGNSLFAEVDDKRQEMLKALSQMKDKVYQLNRELECKQAEVDALMCEKKTLWEDYSGQARHHDATLYKAYERRITDLEKQNKQLNRDIARWFDKHIDPQSSEASQWISGVLDHYKKENLKLTTELTASSVNNLSVALELRELQRQIVTWRTKALEAKACVSELESKLIIAEKSMQVVNSTNIITSPLAQNETDTMRSGKMLKFETSGTPKDGLSQADISVIKKLDESRHESRTKENQTPNIIPGILATGGEGRKVAKVTCFKQES